MSFLRSEPLVAGMPSASPKSMGGMGLLEMSGGSCIELELELIQSQMAQKTKLRGEVGARAWRA